MLCSSTLAREADPKCLLVRADWCFLYRSDRLPPRALSPAFGRPQVKHTHEFRDPIHVFITLDSDERRVVDSRPFQRLRYIHQLATSFLIFPGATHRRFEHSLGVMHLAGLVFDIVTQPNNVHSEVKEYMPGDHQRGYRRRVVRLAALCHDIGHLPFSHAAEHELLPDGWNHERLTYDLVMAPEMRDILMNSIPPILPEHVAKIAIGLKKLSEFRDDVRFDMWETFAIGVYRR